MLILRGFFATMLPPVSSCLPGPFLPYRKTSLEISDSRFCGKSVEPRKVAMSVFRERSPRLPPDESPIPRGNGWFRRYAMLTYSGIRLWMLLRKPVCGCREFLELSDRCFRFFEVPY